MLNVDQSLWQELDRCDVPVQLSCAVPKCACTRSPSHTLHLFCGYPQSASGLISTCPRGWFYCTPCASCLVFLSLLATARGVMKTWNQHLLVTSSQRRAITSGVDDFFATNGVDLVLVLARFCLGSLAVKFDEAQSCHSGVGERGVWRTVLLLPAVV